MTEVQQRLMDIQECIRRIEDYTSQGKEVFLQSTLIQDAVARNFEIIGEATKAIPQEFREKYPDIPWKLMAGFRDMLIHDYIRVDYEEVWNTLDRNLDDLKEQIEQILEELETNKE